MKIPGKILLVVAAIFGLCFFIHECRDPKRIAERRSKEQQKAALITPTPTAPPEIRLIAHPDKVSNPAMIWEKFGSNADYVVIRRGNVLAFEDGKKSNPLLLTPNNMEVPIRAKWHIAFKSAESGPVEVIIRKL